MRNWEITIPVGLFVAFFLIVLCYAGWQDYEVRSATEMCKPYKLEKSHLSEDVPWVSCTHGTSVWSVRKHREFR